VDCRKRNDESDALWIVEKEMMKGNKMEMKKLIQIAGELNAIKTDEGKWRYVIANKEVLGVELDNDATYPGFNESAVPRDIEDYDDLPFLDEFKFDIGNRRGVETLLDILGIRSRRIAEEEAERIRQDAYHIEVIDNEAFVSMLKNGISPTLAGKIMQLLKAGEIANVRICY